MHKIPVSVVVITKNEEENIRTCLESVHGWVDETVIVDDESTDRTVELAREFTDKIFHRKMENEGIHRNWAHQQTRNEWILSLDADESVTEELKQSIIQTIPNTEVDAFNIKSRNFLGDYWIRYGGWYFGKLKMFKKSLFRYEEVEVHPRVFFQGKAGDLEGDLIHKLANNFEQFLGSLNRQTTLEARKWILTNRKMTFGKAMWRAVDRFPRRYFRKKGRKDGFIGFMMAFFDSLYQIMSYAKFWEMKRTQGK
ncbi:MAG: glycosyltransferase family 2 protein [Candidatus Omnitrophota bacterium]